MGATWWTVLKTSDIEVQLQAELRKRSDGSGAPRAYRWRTREDWTWTEPQGLTAADDYKRLVARLINIACGNARQPEPTRDDVLDLLTTTKLEDDDAD